MLQKFDINELIESNLKRRVIIYPDNILNDPMRGPLGDQVWYRINYDKILEGGSLQKSIADNKNYGIPAYLDDKYSQWQAIGYLELINATGNMYFTKIYSLDFSTLNREIEYNLDNTDYCPNYLVHKIPGVKNPNDSMRNNIIELHQPSMYYSDITTIKPSFIYFMEYCHIPNLSNLIFQDYVVNWYSIIRNRSGAFNAKYLSKCYFNRTRMNLGGFEIESSVVEDSILELNHTLECSKYGNPRDFSTLDFSLITNSSIAIKLQDQMSYNGERPFSSYFLKESEFYHSKLVIESDVPIELSFNKCHFHNTVIEHGNHIKIKYLNCSFTNNPIYRPELYTANEINKLFDTGDFFVKSEV